MIKSVLSNWMTLVVSSVLSILITPILVRKLGPAHYGMWVLTGSVIDYYGLLDMGMRAALFRFTARFKGAGSRCALDETFATAVSFALVVSAIIILTIPVVAVLAPHFLKLDPLLVSKFRLVVLFMGIAMAVVFSARTLSTFVASLGRFDLSNLADSSSIVIRTVAIYAVLRMGFGIVAVSLSVLLANMVFLFFGWVNVRRADPSMHVRFRNASWARIRELASFSMYISLNSCGDYFRFYTDSIVITRMLSVDLVTFFSIPGKLLFYLQALIVGFGAPINALFNSLDAQKREDELRAYFIHATRIAAVMTLLIAVILAVNGGAFLTLWIGRDMTLSTSILHVLLLGYVAVLSQHPCVLLLVARGRQKTLGFLSLIEGVLNLGLSIVWARKYGVLGVAWGTTVPMVVFSTIIYPLVSTRCAGMSLKTYLNQALARPVAVAVSGFLLLLMIQEQRVSSWYQLLVNVSWQTMALGAAFLFVALETDDWNYLKAALNSFVHRLQAATVGIG
jgi:O-antigen/teichoic acid export membrane protein